MRPPAGAPAAGPGGPGAPTVQKAPAVLVMRPLEGPPPAGPPERPVTPEVKRKVGPASAAAPPPKRHRRLQGGPGSKAGEEDQRPREGSQQKGRRRRKAPPAPIEGNFRKLARACDEKREELRRLTAQVQDRKDELELIGIQLDGIQWDISRTRKGKPGGIQRRLDDGRGHRGGISDR